MEGERWDVVLTDINMPEFDGIELIRELRAHYRNIPVIAFTGGGAVSTELLLENAQLLGAVSTLPKPVQVDELQTAVEAALARSAFPHGPPGG